MPNKGRNDVKKTAINLNSKWLQNALKSMGVAAGETFKDIMPSASTTITSTAKIATDTAKSIRGNKVSSDKITNAITSNPIVKMGQDYFKNAIEDLKSGHLYNDDRAMGGFDDAFSDMDTLFDDIDDYFGDDESPDQETTNVNINKNVINPPSKNNDATVKAIQQNGEYQLKSSKAAVNTMVSVSSTLMVKMSELGSQIMSELSTVNTNLKSLIEYNNENMTKFIEASIGYYEQASAAFGKEEDNSNSSSGVKPENFITSKGLDFNDYKEYVKGNISKVKSDSTVGSMVSMVLENKEMFISNPIGMLMQMGMKAALPTVLKDTMATVDKAVQNIVPVMLSRLSGLGKGERGVAANIKQLVGQVLGVDIGKNEKFDTSKAIKKGPMPYNGVANHSIVEIIPRYLRESNNYLKEIAKAITGKSNDQLNEGVEGFDWFDGRTKKREDIKSDVYDQVLNEITSAFERSSFGEKLSNQSKYLDDESAEEYNNVLNQFYLSLERFDKKIDFSEQQISELLDTVNGSSSAKNLLAESLSQMRENDSNALLDAEASKLRATVRRNSTMNDIQNDAFDRGLFQIDTSESIDDYALRKYGASPNGSISTQSVNMSVPSLLQGIQSTLNRGIYVKVVRKFKGVSGEQNADMDESATVNEQTKREFTDSVNKDSSGNELNRDFFREQMSLNQEFTANQTKTEKRFSDIFKSLLYGDADKAFDDVVDATGNIFSKASGFLSTHFLNPIKKELFGEKNENGYVKGGLFEGVNNKLKESFFSFRRILTGKGYVDSNGATVPDANEEEMKNTITGKFKSLVHTTKESIKVRLFGEKDEDGNVVEGKGGVLGVFTKKMSFVTSSIAKGINGWKTALFGGSEDENKDEDPKETITNTVKDIKEKAKKVLPDALFGSTLGFGYGALAGGSILGTLVGGPIGGALIGFAGGIVSKSTRFQNWLFGEKDENGERTGGLISKKTQDYFKKNDKFLAGGLALGAIKGTFLPGSGLLTSIVGGPIAGALVGLGTSMLLKSNTFQKFLFGDEKSGQLGLVTNVKNWLGRFGKNKDGESDGSKLFGMGAIGMGTGGLLGMLVGGPIVGSALGLGAAIVAQKDNFREWFFGKTDENGNKKEGILGKFKNMLVVDVFHPIKNTFKDIGDDFKTFLKYDILNAFNLVIEPLGDAFFAGVSKLTGKLTTSFNDFGNYIKENFLHGFIDKAGAVLSPITNAASNVAKGIYGVSKQIISAPLKVLSAVTSPIANAVAGTVASVAKVAFKGIDLLLVKPIKNLVLKPLGFVAKTVGKVVFAPFKLLGNVAESVGDKLTAGIEHISRFAGRIKDGIVNAILNSAPVKAVKKGVQAVKNFGVHIKDTITEFISPVTDFVKTSITAVKDKITGAIGGFFKRVLGFFNPLNWFRKGKNLLSRLAGNDPSDEPKRESRLARIWRETARGADAPDHSDTIIKDANGNIIDSTESNGKRRKFNKEAKNAELAKNKLSKEERKNITKNEKIIRKYTKGQKYVDSVENRAIVEYEAKKRGVVIDWGKVKAQEDPTMKVQNESLKVQSQSKEYLKEIADFILGRTHKTSNTETRSEAIDQGKEDQAKIISKNEEVRDAKSNAKSNEERKSAKIASDDRQKQRKKESEGRTTRFKDNFENYGLVDGLKQNMAYMKGVFRQNSETHEDRKIKRKYEIEKKRAEKDQRRDEKRLAKEERKRQKWAKKNGIHIDEPNYSDIPKHAKGTDNADAGLAIVGENGPEAVYSDKGDTGRLVGTKGPEVVNLNKGDKVIPNDRINSNDAVVGTTSYTDKKILQVSDSTKLSLPVRVLRALIEIKDSLNAGLKNPFAMFNGNGDGSQSDNVDNGDTEQEVVDDNESTEDYDDTPVYDTTNIDKVKSALSGGSKALLSMIPGYNLVKGAIGFGRNVVGAGKTIFGAGKELATIGFDKMNRAVDKGIKTGQAIKNTVLHGLGKNNEEDSKDEETDATVKEIQNEKSEESQDEVNSLTGEKLRAEKEAEREEDSDDAREDAKVAALENLNTGQTEHNKAWDFIFSKKGLITGALLALSPLLIKAFNWIMSGGFGNALGGWISSALGNLDFGLGSLTDGMSSLEVIAKKVSNLWDGIKQIFHLSDDPSSSDSSDSSSSDSSTDDSSDDRSIVDRYLYDEDGNVTNETGARAKLGAKVGARSVAKNTGKIYAIYKALKEGKGITGKVKNLFSAETRQYFGKKGKKKAIQKGSDLLVDHGKKNMKAGMEKIFGNKVAEEGAEKATTTVAEKGAATIAEEGAEKVTTKVAEEGVEKVATKVAEEGAEKGAAKVAEEGAEKVAAKVATEGAEKAADAAKKTVLSKVIDAITSFFTTIGSKLTKKFPKLAEKFADSLLGKVISCLKKYISKIFTKLMGILQLNVGLAETGIGWLAKEGLGLSLGAINGASGAARLFKVDNPDATMIVISTALGAFAGSTIGSIVDVVNELTVSILGLDIFSEFASLAYRGIMTLTGNEDKIKEMEKEQNEFKEKYEESTDAQISDQYDSMKAAGIIDADMTEEEFNEKARNGEIDGVKIQSFADYNDEQHKTIGAHIWDATKGAGSAIAKAAKSIGGWFGGKDTSYKMDANGNKYTKNDDGSWTIIDKDGNEKGTLTDEQMSQVPEVTDVKQTEKGVFQKAGEAISQGFSNVAEGTKELGKKVFNKSKEVVTRLNNGIISSAATVRNFFTKHKEYRWRSIDGGYYQFNGDTFDYYNASGDKISEGISRDDFTALVNNGTVIKDSKEEVTVSSGLSEKWHDATSLLKTGFNNVADLFHKFTSRLADSGNEELSYIAEHGVISYIGAIFKHEKGKKVIDPADGFSYYVLDPDGKFYKKYNIQGDVISERIPAEKIDELISKGMLTQTDEDVEVDTGAKAAFKNVLGLVKQSMSKAKEIASKSWNSFKNFLGLSDSSDDTPSSSSGGSGTGPKPVTLGGGRGEEPSTLNGSVYYSQNDPAWKNDRFVKSDGTDDGATIGNSGCGPTAMSMVVSSMKNRNVSPLEMARFAQESGTRDDTGTNWNFVNTAAQNYGIDSTSSYNPSRSFIEASLRNGNPMILSGTDDGSGKSPYTTAGHYVVATGIDSNGNVLINDPRGKSYSGRKNLSSFIGNTGAAWSFSNSGARGGRGAFVRHIIGGGRNIDVSKWVSIIKAVKAAIAAKKLGYSQSRYTDITLDGKTIKVRTDCSGLVSACLTFYGVLNAGTYVTSRTLVNMSDPTMSKTGFTPRKFTNWESCQVGDILAINGHTEIFAGMSNGSPTVWNCGSDSSCNDPGTCGVAHKEGYTTIWSPGDAGSGAVSGTLSTDASTSSDSSSSTETSFITKVSGAFSSVLNAGLNAALTGDYNEDWDSILNGGSQQSSSSSGAEPTGTVTVNNGDTPKAVWDYLKTNGFSDAAAAGILGNMQQESGVDPTKIQSNGAGPAAGIVQWENYNTKSARWKSMSDYAASKGKDWTDLQSQLEFMLKELNGLDSYFKLTRDIEGRSTGSTTFDQFKSSSDVVDATYQFEKAFERAGKPNMANRVSAAQEYNTKFVNSSSTSSDSSSSSSVVGPQPVAQDGNLSLTAGGSGDGVSISKKKYVGLDNGSRGDNSDNISAKQINLVKDIKLRDSNLTNSNNVSNDNTIGELLKEVITLLSDISNKSNNLSYLKGIDKIKTNNIITNTTVQTPDKSGTKVVPTGSNKISVDEVTARKIAFGY